MNVTLHQAVYCNGDCSIDNYVKIEKSHENSTVPRKGEKVYVFIWEDNVETEVVEIGYDLDNQTCDVSLAMRITDMDKDAFKRIAGLHGWRVIV